MNEADRDTFIRMQEHLKHLDDKTDRIEASQKRIEEALTNFIENTAPSKFASKASVNKIWGVLAGIGASVGMWLLSRLLENTFPKL
jgi:hypothetical protein